MAGIRPAFQFDSAPRPIADLLALMNSVSGSPVTRESALTVMAVLRGRNELVSLATIPLRQYRGLDVIESPLLRQIDPDVPNVITMSRTLEDLVMVRTAWWQITGQDFDGYPVSARFVPYEKVSLEPPDSKTPVPPGKWVWVDGKRVSMSLMIRFDSPNPGLLSAGAKAIRRALLLDNLASTYAENPRPLDYYTDTDDPNIEPLTQEQIPGFLAQMRSSAARLGTVWLPSKVKRVDINAPSPAELQLVELQAQVTKEIANAIGVDAEDLGVSTTSRTYQNEDARRRDKINRMFAPFMSAITDRLSMGDVTRRGHLIKFDLTDYLKADPTTQIAVWQALKDMGAMSASEVRAAYGLSGPPPADAAAVAAVAASDPRPAIQLGDITPQLPLSSWPPGTQPALPPAGRRSFDAGVSLTFAAAEFAGDVAAPTVDTARRRITGLAVPYNKIGQKYGEAYRFLPGSLEYGDHVKHFKDHAVPVGNLEKLTDGPDGPVVELSVHDGVEGSPQKYERDQLLFDADGGLYNGLSVGVDFDLLHDATYNEDDGVWDVHRATLREVSSTSMPTFDDARVTKVAASRTGGNMDPCQHCGHRHAPGIACATHAARVAAFSQPAPQPGQLQPAPQPGQPQPPPQPHPTPVPAGADPNLYAAFAAFQQAQQQIGALPTAEQAARQFVNADHGAAGAAQVTEPPPYRFDRRGNLRRGSHDFSTDLAAGWREGGGGDLAARDRAQSFITTAFADGSALANLAVSEQFAVTSGNVAALNPNRNRPDMYVDQMEYTYPLWEAINKGTLEDITPFVIPKFNTSSGLVANHVEGTEPTPGAFTATAQTITPSAVSGKVEYTREAWDQGGNPQASGLIWTQMVRGYYEALEAYAVSSLAGVAASLPDITITTAAADATLDQALVDAIVPLHYIRGGQRFRKAFTQIDLYKAMAKAKDSAGRRLYPAIGPMNAAGTADEDYATIRAHGIDWLPAWALAATGIVAASSYMFDPQRVCGWATAPQRLDISWRVAWVDIGIWGYKAFGVTDFAGTREVIYDPV